MTIQEYNDIYKNPIVKSMEITSSGGVTITNTNICMEQMSLEESLCSENSLVFGACESGCFKIRIADLNHNFEGEWLTVNQLVAIDDSGCLLKEDGSYLLTEDGDRISLGAHDNAIPYGRFKVFSDKPTNDRRWRDLVCYDAMYDILNAEVIEWYNGLTFPMTMKNFRDSFFTYLGITQETTTLVNDSFMIQGGFSNEGSLSGKTIITSICELNGVFGHISRQGEFEYISLPSADSLTLDWYMDGTGAYEDYTVQKITGITAKSSEEDVGTTVGTDTNVYIVQDNPLIYGSEGTQGLTTALTNLLNNVKDITYRPFNVNTYGNPMLPLGTNLTISTRNQTINSFLMSRVLSGIQSLKDSISADGEQYVPSQVNSLRTETKRTKGKIHELVNNVDELRSTISDLDERVESEIQQLADTIVLKVDANGNIVKVELSANPSTGSTFAVNADNISFTAGSVLRFNANNIVIESTYFKVDQYGNLTSTSGTIGGWDINAHSLSYDYTNSGYNYSASLFCDGSDVYISTKYGLPQYTSESALLNGGIYLRSDGGNVGGQLYNLMSISCGIVGSGSSVTSTYPIITLYDSRYFGGDNTISSANITNNGLSVFKNNTIQTEVGDTIRLPYLNTYSKVLAVDGTSDQKIVATNTTITEVEYVHGVTSNIQTQLNGKQATITGGATTIVSDNLTASKALVSNANGKVAVSSVTATELGYVSGATSNIQGQIDGLGAKSVSGNPVAITDAEAMNANSVVATITPTQTGSGTPSPSNVRPFVGYSNITIDRFGKNLCEPARYVSISNNDITYTDPGGDLNITQAIKLKPGTYTASLLLKSKPNTARTLTFRTGRYSGTILASFSNIQNYNVNQQYSVTFTLEEETEFIGWLYGSNGGTFTIQMMIEVGSTATSYETYQGKTYTVQLGDTYYQCVLDLTRGVFRSEYKIKDLSTFTWRANTDIIGRWWLQNPFNDIVPVASTAEPMDTVCDSFQVYSADDMYGDHNLIGISMDASNYILVRNGSTTDTPTGNIVYRTKNPIEIQLTPTQIALLENNNTITTNVSSLDITYQTNNGIGDTASALDKRVASLESTQNYSLSEQKTGKYWIDGKPIYQKTFNLTLTEGPSTSHAFEKNVDVTDLNIDMMISIEGVWRRTVSGGWNAYYQLGGNESGYGDSCGRLSSDKKTITLLFKTEGTNSQIFTIKYTKAS